MDEMISFDPEQQRRAAALGELAECNDVSAGFGLALTREELAELQEARNKALSDTGRVEFGGGVLKKLVYAFCDSPFVNSENYEATLMELQDSFYYFKSESEDNLTDDELIEYMSKFFNGRAQGSIEYMACTSLQELCRYARGGGDAPEDMLF